MARTFALTEQNIELTVADLRPHSGGSQCSSSSVRYSGVSIFRSSHAPGDSTPLFRFRFFSGANGVMAFCFYTISTPHILLCEAVTAFVGGTLFWIGAYLSYVEALNPAAHAHFGWEVEHDAKRLVEPRAVAGGAALGRGRRHFGKHVRVVGGEADAEKGKTDFENGEQKRGQQQPPPKWKWVGADWSSFGFVANVIQLYGASIL